jgi:fluoroacetyl-CoA thioesterase
VASVSELREGVERQDTFEVDDKLVTNVGGTLKFEVLSTPGMIAMMEQCSALLAAEHLPEDKATVGFEVCVKHVGAVAKGAECTVRARLREIVDGRKLRFDVEVLADDDRTIGVGTHERRVVDTAMLGG